MEQDWIVTSSGSNVSPTLNQMDNLLDRFRIDSENQLLKYAVSKVMFCQSHGCGKILDYRKAVLITFKTGNFFLICEDCFNSPVVQAILDTNLSKTVVKSVQRYQDWDKMQAEEKKRLEVERQQLKLDLFNSTSKN
jgi:hypothetical protein